MSDASPTSPTSNKRKKDLKNRAKNRNQLRTESLNKAFEKLRQQLPEGQRKVKWTKLLILRMAIDYIRSLDTMLGLDLEVGAACGDTADPFQHGQPSLSGYGHQEQYQYVDPCSYTIPNTFHPSLVQLHCPGNPVMCNLNAGYGSPEVCTSRGYEGVGLVTYDVLSKLMNPAGAVSQPPREQFYREVSGERDWRGALNTNNNLVLMRSATTATMDCADPLRTHTVEERNYLFA